mmetsp:Transcript_76/g.130  ORF Transcript_76/g.130 Transcript_76/m.130 type:complete len:634 (-) Transcript_76:159-2060(-)|eukprot:CAMPEP_0182450442 /NCGR_PEP_ID=MMETSP1172-20130603/41307_1 /TAXON_ID=708627 /ORGANISM="Timspurckia oligopyrenoides, Strain CCMP3278" /LENGTH=633 /DNA_ID=CAMNT_0024648053 /DNA_START=211 /DNA_END=2112 /DNA_ORIENTATION=+
MMRRTTLGPVSSSGMNSRLSMGGNAMRQAPSAVTKEDRRISSIPSAAGRLSTIGNGATRRGSVASTRLSRASGISAYGNRPGAKADPRPVSDKSHMQQCIRNLICFLTEHGFDQAISPKLLSTPTSKDFQHILTFLVRQIDPAFAFEKRFEDEVPLLLKTLRYPFTISKSALHAVGSPHTWPTLLAVLSWILELLQYDDVAQNTKLLSGAEDEEDEQTGGQFGKDLFFGYVSRTYDAFLGGDDEFTELEDELSAVFELRDASCESRVHQLEEENEKMRFEIEELKCQESPLVELSRRKAQYEHDIAKFYKLLDKLRAHNVLLTHKLDEKRVELAGKQTERHSAVTEKNELKAIILEQDSLAIDAQRIASDRALLKKALHASAEEREAAEREHSKAQSQVAEHTRLIETLLTDYQQRAERLQLIPATASNARGVQYTLNLTRNASVTRADQMLSIDLQSVIQPTLVQLKQTFGDDIGHALEEKLRLQERVNELDEQLELRKDEIRNAEGRRDRLEANYKSERDALSEQLQSSATELLRMEEFIQTMKRETDDRLRSSQTALEEIHQEYRNKKSLYQSEKQTIADNLYETMEILTAHKAHVQEKLDLIKTSTDDLYLEFLNPPSSSFSQSLHSSA